MHGMSALQLEGLLQFYRVEPFGTLRDDLRMGVIAAMVYNKARTKKSQETLSAEDFVLFSEIPKLKRAARASSRARFDSAIARSRQNRKKRLEDEEAARGT